MLARLLFILVTVGVIAYVAITRFSGGRILVPSPTPFPIALLVTRLSQCPPKSFPCYEKQMDEIAAAHGTRNAYTVLATAATTSDDVDYHCHTLMHYLGEDALASASGSIPKALQQGDIACQSGFSHGALEDFFGETAETELPIALPSVCRDEDRVGQDTQKHCWHAVGHGLGFLYDNDIYKAASRCEYLKEIWEQEACFEGVFMENFGSDGRQHKPTLVSADTPLEPCLSVRTKYKHACFATIGTHLLRLTQNDAQKARELCGQVEEQYREVCQQGTATQY